MTTTQCTCTPAYFCADENQMEPAQQCDDCHSREIYEGMAQDIQRQAEEDAWYATEIAHHRHREEFVDDLPF
jgi:hypothetical protein